MFIVTLFVTYDGLNDGFKVPSDRSMIFENDILIIAFELSWINVFFQCALIWALSSLQRTLFTQNATRNRSVDGLIYSRNWEGLLEMTQFGSKINHDRKAVFISQISVFFYVKNTQFMSKILNLHLKRMFFCENTVFDHTFLMKILFLISQICVFT